MLVLGWLLGRPGGSSGWPGGPYRGGPGGRVGGRGWSRGATQLDPASATSWNGVSVNNGKWGVQRLPDRLPKSIGKERHWNSSSNDQDKREEHRKCSQVGSRDLDGLTQSAVALKSRFDSA